MGNADLARDLIEQDRILTRAYIPLGHTWDRVRRSPVDLGERLTGAMKAIVREVGLPIAHILDPQGRPEGRF